MLVEFHLQQTILDAYIRELGKGYQYKEWSAVLA